MVLPNTRTIPQVLKRSKKPCNTRSRHPTKIPIQRETPVSFVSGFHKGCHPSTAACMHNYESGTAADSPPTRFNYCHPPKPYQPQSMQKGGGTTVRLTSQRSRIHNQPSTAGSSTRNSSTPRWDWMHHMHAPASRPHWPCSMTSSTCHRPCSILPSTCRTSRSAALCSALCRHAHV